MKIYITGPETGQRESIKRFYSAEKEIQKLGHVVINPARVKAQLPDGTSRKEYMAMSECMLAMCDAIFLLDGWCRSQECNAEVAYALQHGLVIVPEGKSFEEYFA